MKSRILEWFAITLIIAAGLLHLLAAPAVYAEAAYLGILFVANFCVALAAAYGITRRQRWGWAFGVLIAASSIAGYIWSRTLGLPGMEVKEWFNPIGIIAMSIESLFILIAILRPWRTDTASQRLFPVWLRYAVAILAGIVAMMASLFPHQSDVTLPDPTPMRPLSIGEALRGLSPTSSKTLEEDYGIQVSQVAVTMMNGIVDVRLKVVDLEKADQLLKAEPALLVGDTLVRAPNMHRHALRQGKPYFIFYSNQQQLVQTGTPVSLVFGTFRTEPITAK